ncbi:MAG: hypothetical protein ABMA64_00245 [Myxococcota bacterium]
MKAYHYSVVHCRDGARSGEAHNVGLLVVSPGDRAWIRRADVKSRTHLVGDPAQFVRAMLDLYQEEATEVARSGAADVVYDWLRRRSIATEDSVFLGPPALGITADLKAEMARLAVKYLGKAPSRGRPNLAEAASQRALRETKLIDRFRPREFPVGPATWGFPHVGDHAGHPLIVQALSFEQKSAESVLDGAFKNVGRFGEVRRAYPGTQLLAVSAGPTEGDLGSAFRMASERMTEAGIWVVRPEVDAVTDALSRLGVEAGDVASA